MSTVKVILREDIPKLGDAGDVVEVKPGFARNYLIPKGIAMPATSARVNEIEHHRRIIADRQAASLKDLKAAGAKIREMELSFEAQAGETGKLFGSVTSAQIAAKMKEQGIDVDRRKIQTDAIKTVGVHDVKVRLQKDLIIDVKVTVTASAQSTQDDAAFLLLNAEPEPVGFGSMEE
jgi:large subunit ribosomal protein L9